MKFLELLHSPLHLFVLLITLCSGCKTEDYSLGATAIVNVVDVHNAPIEGKAVYIFRADEEADSFRQTEALFTEQTNQYGIATFILPLDENWISEGQAPLYFAVDYDTKNGTSQVRERREITVSAGETISITLVLPEP